MTFNEYWNSDKTRRLFFAPGPQEAWNAAKDDSDIEIQRLKGIIEELAIQHDNLGPDVELTDAIEARKDAEKAYHGEFAYQEESAA